MDKYNINIMKYIKTFEQHDDYVDYTESQDYITPNLSYCIEENEVHFNKYVRNYSKEYFTIEALEDGNVYFKYQEWSPIETQRYMEYSKDGGETWVRTNNVDGDEAVMTIPMSEGEIAFVRGDNDTLASYNEIEDWYYNPFFYSGIEFSVYGNIMSLIHGDDFIGETTVTDYMFSSLFFDSYSQELDVQIINAENLILPATTLADYCYSTMFQGCSSLTTAPELPATTLADGCYTSMFGDCASLTTAPVLSATILADYCYSVMFGGCTSLTTAPVLSATILADGCYSSMFYACTGLTAAPELPATTLTDYCYSGMFNGCTSLTTAPELPATILVDLCYSSMFRGCTNLNYIKAMFITTPSVTYTSNWVNGVASTGTFVKSSVAAWNVTGVHGVPSGWTVQTIGGNG